MGSNPVMPPDALALNTDDLHWEMPSHLRGPMPPELNLIFPNNLLNPFRMFFNGPYWWKAIPVPRAFKLPVPAYQQVEDVITVPPGSYLVAFAGAATLNQTTTVSSGFRFSIFDVGANDWALSDRFLQNVTDAQDNAGTNGAIPAVLTPPYAVVAPGQLQVRVVNSANAACDLQLLLHFAIPYLGRPGSPGVPSGGGR